MEVLGFVYTLCYLGLPFLIDMNEHLGMYFLIGGVPMLIWAGFLQNKELAKKKDALKELSKDLDKKIKNIKDFNASDYMYNQENTYGMAIDNINKKFCIVGKNTERVYSYNDLLGVELIENGKTITKTSRGSQVAGAVVGGLLLGGAGAIIGGLSGKKETIKLINNIKLKITLNDNENPIFEFDFFTRNSKEDNPSSQINKAQRWNSVLNAIILQKEENKKQKEHIDNQKSISVADEILKLKALKDEGIITDDEFEIQKNKLLT